MTEIEPGHVRILEDYLAKLDPPRSKVTVSHYVRLLKAFFYRPIIAGHCQGPNPMREVKPHVVSIKRREYSDDELRRILDAAKQIET